MIKFTAKRLVSGIVLLVIVAVASFFLAHIAIGDPTQALLGSTAKPAQRAALRQQLGLNQPLIEQFWTWFRHAITGNLGTSWANHDSVNSELATKLPTTLSVVVFGIIICAVVGTVFGLISGLRPGSPIDRIVKGAAVILFALPGFWVSLILITWFAVDLKIFPAVGYVPPSQSFSGWLLSITLPAVSLALGGIVSIAEQLRNAIVSIGNQDFVRTLRSRGLPSWSITIHLLRNAAPAALTVLSLQFVGLLGGAIVVETIFNLPGIGAATSSASLVGDIPVLLGITVVSVLFVVIVNFLLDLVLGWINPKARVQ